MTQNSYSNEFTRYRGDVKYINYTATLSSHPSSSVSPVTSGLTSVTHLLTRIIRLLTSVTHLVSVLVAAFVVTPHVVLSLAVDGAGGAVEVVVAKQRQVHLQTEGRTTGVRHRSTTHEYDT